MFDPYNATFIEYILRKTHETRLDENFDSSTKHIMHIVKSVPFARAWSELRQGTLIERLTSDQKQFILSVITEPYYILAFCRRANMKFSVHHFNDPILAIPQYVDPTPMIGFKCELKPSECTVDLLDVGRYMMEYRLIQLRDLCTKLTNQIIELKIECTMCGDSTTPIDIIRDIEYYNSILEMYTY